MNKDNTKGLSVVNIAIAWLMIGFVVGLLTATACNKEQNAKYINLTKQVDAFKDYYNGVETLLDSLDYTHGLDLMDTDLCTDYGTNYLDCKAKVDSLTFKQY